MATATTELRKALGVRATTEQRRILSDAARRDNRSVSNFVLEAALREAARVAPKPKPSREEFEELLHKAQDAIRRANPTGRSLVDELIAERRAEAVRE